jgi:hypothetical protein
VSEALSSADWLIAAGHDFNRSGDRKIGPGGDDPPPLRE